MALINCPSCSKKISNKSKICPHCTFAFGNATPEDLERKVQLTRYKKQQSIQNQSLVAMLLFITGFGFMYWGGTQPGDTQHTMAMGLSVVGFCWYIVNRVRLAMAKRK